MELLQGEGWVSSDAFLDLVHRHWSLDDLVVVEELLTFVSSDARIASLLTFLSTGFRKYWFRSSFNSDLRAFVSL